MDWPVTIAGATDPRIAPYLNIRDRELVGRQGSFMAEGSVVVRALLASERFAPQSALILENRLAGLGDVVEAMRQRGLPVYVASQPVIDAIAGFHLHRGVLAVGATRPAPEIDDVIRSLPAQAVAVVCIGISNHDNIGAILRNARGLGAHAVFYDSASCDPFYRKAIRVSVGAVFGMPHTRFHDVDLLREKLATAGFRQMALSPAGKIDLRALEPAPRTALYVGAEGPGLPETLMQSLETVRIDMPAGFDSLNVATACALGVYQLTGKARG